MRVCAGDKCVLVCVCVFAREGVQECDRRSVGKRACVCGLCSVVYI